MQDSILQNLHFILSTSPMWDRVELKGDKNLLGEFIEFKGRHEDVQLLKNLKRSKVRRFIVQKLALFGGFGRSRVQILYSPRDYRAKGTSSSEWKEISVKQYTEIVFQPLHSEIQTVKCCFSDTECLISNSCTKHLGHQFSVAL